MWTAERMWGAGSRNGMTTNGFVARNERAAQRGRNHRRYRVTAGPEANGGQWPSTKINVRSCATVRKSAALPLA